MEIEGFSYSRLFYSPEEEIKLVRVQVRIGIGSF